MKGKPVRRTQAIAPFGPGAIVDFPGPVSLIHAGLEAYPFDSENPDHEEFKITDEVRLSDRLGVQYFVEPIDYRPSRRGVKQKNVNLVLPFLRFPLWHLCPRCGILHKSDYHYTNTPKCSGPIGSGADKGKSHPERDCFQVRFVVACEKGHLSDFPWCDWIHDGKDTFNVTPGKSWLRWRASGNASVAGIEIAAEEIRDGNIKVIKRKTLGQVFSAPEKKSESGDLALSPLGKIGIVCNGDNPTLAKGSELRPGDPCGEQLYVLLKNASNLYFPNVKSAIFIPTINNIDIDPDIRDLTQNPEVVSRLRVAAMNSDDGLVGQRPANRILKELYPQFDTEEKAAALREVANSHMLHDFLESHHSTRIFIKQIRESSETGDLTLEQYQMCLDKLDWGLDPQLLVERSFQDGLEQKPPVFMNQIEEDEFEEEVFRSAEYQVFSRESDSGTSKVDLDVSVVDSSEYPDWMAQRFSRISLLKKMRETRVFTGFSRIFSHGLSKIERQALFLEESEPSWLPGVIVRGEGLFFDFKQSHLDTWYNNNIDYLKSREALLTRSKASYLNISEGAVTPVSAKKVLIHTFAHVLINELIYDCGYGSASLRERLYCSSRTNPEMNAVLVYTAAGDTEGSMGGLVRMGEPDRLASVIEQAIVRASWCSSDPICIESSGQGPSGQNLAACHACALLPETSCEQMNLQLDRSMLVGTLQNPSIGFFSELLS